MGAETGATCSIFDFDNSMTEYLSATGRKEVADLALKNRIICQQTVRFMLIRPNIMISI